MEDPSKKKIVTFASGTMHRYTTKYCRHCKHKPHVSQDKPLRTDAVLQKQEKNQLAIYGVM